MAIDTPVVDMVEYFTKDMVTETPIFTANIEKVDIHSNEEGTIAMKMSIDTFSWIQGYFNTYSGIVVTSQVNLNTELNDLQVL